MKRSSNPAAPVLYGAVLLVAVATAGPASAQKAAFTGSEYATAPSSCQGMPPAGSSVNAGDARCGDSGSWEALPASTVSCLQDATRQHLLDRFRKGEIAVGPNASTAQAEFQLKNRGVTVRQYAWPVWVDSAMNGALPYEGCAAGVALPSEVRVSLREGEVRARRMIAWETANSLVTWALDRGDLGRCPDYC